MPDISVVILTYNSQDYIGLLLESLISKYKEKIIKDKLEIIVCDNNSADDTLKIVGEIRTEKLRVLVNKENLGFAKGINLGAKQARGKFLLFINPDSVFLEGDIFSLVKKFEDEKVAIVGGRILQRNGKPELSCGKFYNFSNTLLLALGLEEKFGVRFSPVKDRVVDFVSGGFMMVKKEIFEKANGFDEKLFMYTEDMELCFRLKKQGYKVLFSSSATIKHAGQGSANRSFAVLNIYKGLLYFHKKNMGKISYFLVRLLLLKKAIALVLIGKISNNQYLAQTYSQAIKICL